MNGIYKLESGTKIPVDIHRMFGTHGPYMMDEQRLDMLTKVTLLVDASTITSHQTGEQSSTAETSDVIGRAVVGGVLTGGAGAVVGGATAKRDSTLNSKTTQQLHTNLTVELQFIDIRPVHVIVTQLSSYHWLLGELECEPASDDQLREMKRNAQAQAEHEDKEKDRWKRVDDELNEDKPEIYSNGQKNIVNFTTYLVIGLIGSIIGIVYGDFFFSKILFAILFSGITVIIIGLPITIFIEKNKKSARKQYKNKRKEMYDKLFQK